MLSLKKLFISLRDMNHGFCSHLGFWDDMPATIFSYQDIFQSWTGRNIIVIKKAVVSLRHQSKTPQLPVKRIIIHIYFFFVWIYGRLLIGREKTEQRKCKRRYTKDRVLKDSSPKLCVYQLSIGLMLFHVSCGERFFRSQKATE